MMSHEVRKSDDKSVACPMDGWKSQLECFGILAEILIVIGIIISITLARFVADNLMQLIVTLVCGWLVWGYGLVLRIKVGKALRHVGAHDCSTARTMNQDSSVG